MKTTISNSSIWESVFKKLTGQKHYCLSMDGRPKRNREKGAFSNASRLIDVTCLVTDSGLGSDLKCPCRTWNENVEWLP